MRGSRDPVVRYFSFACCVALVVGCGAKAPTTYDTLASAPATVTTTTSSNTLELVRNHAEEILVRVNVPAPKLETVTLDAQPFERVTAAGFESERRGGYPDLPSLTFHVMVPTGKSIVAGTTFTPEMTRVTLPNDLAFVDRLGVHDGRTHLIPQDRAAYEQTHGDVAVEVTDVSWAGPDKLATIKVWPLRYDGRSRQLSVRKSFDVRIAFKDAVTGLDFDRPVSVNAPRIAPYVAINGERQSLIGADAGRVDLVIAHTSHRDALAPLITYKRAHGREVREHYVDGQTAAQVKAYIQGQYQGEAPPTHVLLVGNIDQIPSFRGSSDNSWTDFSYQLLGTDSVPDISLGRVPAHNAAELGAFINKAIARESDQRGNDDVLLTAGRDVSLGCPANVTRVGEKFRRAGDRINVIKKYRSEGTTTDQVLDAYNAGPNITVYDGHGDRQGMQEIPLLINNLSRLTSDRNPIILDIACLNANWGAGANTRNFAEKILLSAEVGAAGILASGGSGYGHDFFQSLGSLMADARNNLDDGDTQLNEVGQVVLGAKILHGSQDRSFWNYYGDPATSVWYAP